MLQNFLDNYLRDITHDSVLLKLLSIGVTLILIALAGVVAYSITKLIINYVIKRITQRSHSKILQSVIKNDGLNLIAHLACAFVLWSGSKFVTRYDDIYSSYLAIALSKLSLLYLFLTVVVILTRLIQSINVYYEKQYAFAKEYPIYSYLNVLTLFVWVVCAILIISFFAGKSPWVLLTGVGAVSAIFLLVFKDTLLGVVSSIQATASNIVRIGDRISIDKYNLDGVVTKISINVVRVRNDDNTTVTIPTYMLTSEMVKNWRNVYQTGARRIKRSLRIDIYSIKLCTPEMIEKLSVYPGVQDYMAKYESHPFTNLELFRIHIECFLHNNPNINQEKTILVRLLESDINGVPLELYAFSNHAVWYDHEHIQSQVFEYCFSTASSFELKAYQAS